ncbi:MAG: class I SAM-dependent methyltransferase [Treponema sp.]|jgi:ubiquinone/menaquinone biosynthesis C-methylase UbiE|nr:class I SAM-dependent methyltransferase [Treponema sp.]
MNNFLSNLRKPEGLGGWLMLTSMNIGHSALSKWGLKQLEIKPGDSILDIGCGGGKNISRMLKRAYTGTVCGLDYAKASVEKSKSLNRKAVLTGRADIRLGTVSRNPWQDGTFDLVTAFETVYFWPDFAHDVREVRRVLKPDGLFFICNEINIPEKGKQPYQFWIRALDLKTYTARDFHRILTDTGFTGIVIQVKGKNGICVSARAQKEA